MSKKPRIKLKHYKILGPKEKHSQNIRTKSVFLH